MPPRTNTAEPEVESVRDEPSAPTTLDPLARELLREIRRSNTALATQMTTGHAAIVAKLGDVVVAVGEIDRDLDARQSGDAAWRDRLSAGATAVWKNDTVQKLLAGLAVYIAWHYLGVAPTPTPVQVAEPVAVEVGSALAAEPAP